MLFLADSVKNCGNMKKKELLFPRLFFLILSIYLLYPNSKYLLVAEKLPTNILHSKILSISYNPQTENIINKLKEK